MIRGNPKEKDIALVFSAHKYDDGYHKILQTLGSQNIKAGFFLTGAYLKNQPSKAKKLYEEGHYVGPHSYDHILYADWEERKTIVSEQEFKNDLIKNKKLIEGLGITHQKDFFLPAYEWHNKDIVTWSKQSGFQLINYTPGVRTAADYTYPEMDGDYLSSAEILKQLLDKESAEDLNGYILLIHLGTDNRRRDKLYDHLDDLIEQLKAKGYSFKRIDDL